MHTLTQSLLKEMKGIGLKAKGFLLMLLALTICTCSGPRLMLGDQILGKQTDYSLFTGKLAKQIKDATECVILKTDVQDFHLWHPERPLTWLLYLQTQDTVYYQSQVLMQRKCLQTKLYQYQLTTRSFSDPYKTVWTGRKQNLHTGYQLQSLLVKDLSLKTKLKR